MSCAAKIPLRCIVVRQRREAKRCDFRYAPTGCKLTETLLWRRSRRRALCSSAECGRSHRCANISALAK